MQFSQIRRLQPQVRETVVESALVAGTFSSSVVGVVSDVRIDAPDQPAGEQWYFPLEQPAIIDSGVTGMVDLSTGWIALRSTLPPEQMIHTLRSVVAGIDPRLALDPVQPMADAISTVEAPRRFNTGLITAFALAALLLAAMGIYTVIAFSVSQRTQEIAVRMAWAHSAATSRGLCSARARKSLPPAALSVFLGRSPSLDSSALSYSESAPQIRSSTQQASVSCWPWRFLPRRFRL